MLPLKILLFLHLSLTPSSPYAADDLCPFERIDFLADGVRKSRLPDVH